MLQLLLSLCYISATSDEAIDDDALIEGIENRLDECHDIVEAVGDFLSIFETPDARRRKEEDESLSDVITEKLETCRAIIDAVTSFRQKLQPPTKTWGYITLQSEELNWLKRELSFSSKNIGMPLFVASEDGDAASDFHSACNGKGPNVVIVESTDGNIFGGYSDLSWTSSSAYAASSNTFLFRLRPKMQRYNVKTERRSYAIYPKSSYGPTFGGGHEIYIAHSALSNTNSYTNGGHTYLFSSSANNYELNDGTKNFRVKDYVVLQALSV